MNRCNLSHTKVVQILREMGWQVATRGPLLRDRLEHHAPDPAFCAWGHRQYPKHRPLYGVAVGSDPETLRALQLLWSAGAHDIWVVGAEPGLATWEVFSYALRNAARDTRLLCARLDDVDRGLAIGVVSREPEWVGRSKALRSKDPVLDIRGMGHSADIDFRLRGE